MGFYYNSLKKNPIAFEICNKVVNYIYNQILYSGILTRQIFIIIVYNLFIITNT